MSHSFCRQCDRSFSHGSFWCCLLHAGLFVVVRHLGPVPHTPQTWSGDAASAPHTEQGTWDQTYHARLTTWSDDVTSAPHTESKAPGMMIPTEQPVGSRQMLPTLSHPASQTEPVEAPGIRRATHASRLDQMMRPQLPTQRARHLGSDAPRPSHDLIRWCDDDHLPTEQPVGSRQMLHALSHPASQTGPVELHTE